MGRREIVNVTEQIVDSGFSSIESRNKAARGEPLLIDLYKNRLVVGKILLKLCIKITQQICKRWNKEEFE